MPAGLGDLLTALGLVLVLEGIALALLPRHLKRVLARIGAMPAHALRAGGLLAAALGLVVIWLVRG